MTAILVDYVDTLAERWPRRENLLVDILMAEVGMCPDVARVRTVYRILDELFPYSSVRLGSAADRRAYYERYNALLLKLLGLPDRHTAAVHCGFLAQPRPWRLKAGALALLKLLAVRGWPVAVLSNFDSGLRRILTTELAVPDDCLTVVLASQECGIEKPDPRFFECALSMLSATADSVIHIGDSISLDYLPARALGMRCLLIDEDGSYSHLPDSVRDLYGAAQALGLT